ncbi:MAG TPA: DUF4268 domain-containing protein [Bellilinea sp.]|nr:DUF4268 domain-containing protein [Bellilinea sp.]
MKLLGRLEKVDLRTVWTNEAIHFTPWLAQEDNLALLGDTIGLDLELSTREQSVGPYRADIVCKDTITDSWVLIENQLERTDHTHLGQLLTYAAGLDAVTIVWIAPRITDEHRAALDWLNEVTDERINFFGLEIELWRIGDSPIAPKFNIVSQPNDWVRTLSASRQSTAGELTPTKQMQLEYWTAFKVYLEEHGSFLKSQKPFPQHWSNFAIGRSGFYLSAQMNTRDSVLNVSLIIDGRDAKAQFRALQAQKAEIEAEIGQPLTWRELPGKKSSDISLYLKDVDPNNRAQWPEQHAWLRQTLEAFHHAFAPRVRNLVVEAMAEENDTA